MKTIVLILIPCIVNAQVSLQMRAGYAFHTIDAFISGAADFSAHNIHLTPEMLIYNKDNAGTTFGLRLSYQYKFLEAGAGRHFYLFSTDEYDKGKNGWLNSVFISGHYKMFFAQLEYMKQPQFSLGVREVIGRTRD